MDQKEQIARIKLLAKEKGLKIKFICNKLGLAETYLSNVSNGKDRMTDERLKIIADLLETTPEYLNGETDDPGLNNPVHALDGVDTSVQNLLKILSQLSPEDLEKVRGYSSWLLSEQNKE